MNNEIGRKITSLTLMTIMIAGGLTFAVPGAMPAAHAANANLFVSAENSQFDNYMSGPQVIEVVVIDSDINDTDEAKGEPDVTVNGKILRMTQAVDGNWYGYFADRNMAIIADSTSQNDGEGLDFGTFCGKDDKLTGSQVGDTVDFGDSVGFTVNDASLGDNGADYFDGVTVTPLPNNICGGTVANDDVPEVNATNNVVREAKDVNTNGGASDDGQIGMDIGFWPVIQLYPLNPTGNVVIQYNKGGGAQTTTLTFDTVDQFAGAELDRATYTQGAQVHATITDLWLNIDPTDEDSWTFGTTGTGSSSAATTSYQVFDENGNTVGDSAENTDDNILTDYLGNLMCEDNCILITTADVQKKGAVITLQDNDDSEIIPVDGDADTVVDPENPLDWSTDGGNLLGNVPITITEQGPNAGVFGSYDESDTSAIRITENAKRGTSASIDYNETPTTILVGFSFGSIDIEVPDDEWNSGEEVPVILVDADANRNSRADEDLDLFNPNVALIPSLRTGDPFTLAENSDSDGAALPTIYVQEGTVVPATLNVEKFSKRGIITSSITDVDELIIDLKATAGDLQASINDPEQGFNGFNLYNQDIRSLTGSSVDVYILQGSIATVLASGDATDADDMIFLGTLGAQSLTNLEGGVEDDLNAMASNSPIALYFDFGTTIEVGIREALVADFFSFGFNDDGQEASERVANQIIRLELEETGDNTSTFEGSLEYTMVNQLNILDASTYEGLSPIANDPTFIVIEDLTDEDAPRVNYLDLGADGVATQVSDQEEAPSHSGIVSFDNDSYKIADTVTITLEDADLNVDSDLIDIYTVVPGTTDPASDAVGEPGLPVLSFGALGRLVDVTLDDQLWAESETCTPTGGADAGLFASGFSLIEQGSTDSGIFEGDFQIPTNWCRPGSDEPETATGLDLEVNYVDFRDASGEIIEVGDSAGIRANTGSVSLDRTVYPVPFGVPANFDVASGDTSPDNRSIFTIHQTGVEDGLPKGSFLANGDLTIHVRVNDPDFDISASGEDVINQNTADLAVGPVKVSVIRGSSTVILGFAGGPLETDGRINVGKTLAGDTQIQFYELSFPDNFGLDSGTYTVTQDGASDAEIEFDDANEGEMSGEDLDFTSGSGHSSQPITIFDGGTPVATGVFIDKDVFGEPGFGEIDEGEVTIVTSDIGLADGPYMVMGDAAGEFIANATFTYVSSVDEGEITVTDPGSGFDDGIVDIGGVEVDFVDAPAVKQFGPITEIAPDAGIFEIDIGVQYTDGPASAICPETEDFDANTAAVDGELTRFTAKSPSDQNFCILQGDILQVEYTDPADASGDVNTVTDSATFDLRNGVLQSDKSVYIIGSDMILTLIEPDFDLDNDAAETYDLDLIEWDSDAATVTMGDNGGEAAAFDPEPTAFRETGDSTGIFQIVIEIPEELANDRLERGEEIVLEYTDWGPSGSDFVGDEDEDVNLTIYTSNFGATVELDQKVYTWTDKVYITIVAPDHNFDSDLIDEIGDTDLDPIKVSTRGSDIDNYKLVETGTDTGIFTGEVILTGFTHDADGDTQTGDANGNDVVSRSPFGQGPTDGLLPADDDDGITVSFEFSEDETVVGSALIRWNIGEVQWLEASYPASGTGVVRVIDPDMNLDPEAVNNFDVDVWSDSDAGGIDLTVTETNEATGIFEGTVFFTVTDESSGHRLRVAEGDTVTAEYEDNTLPDPYTTADELDITATSLIGTVVPPLERAPASNCRVVDAFGNTLSSVAVDQQVQITCDVANGQDREQPFAYLIQIQDANGVTVSLAWITGSLSPGQSFSPALSWIPEGSGAFDVTAFVWESVDNPTALSPPQDISITVN